MKVEGSGSLKSTTLRGACIGINVSEQNSPIDMTNAGTVTLDNYDALIGAAILIPNADNIFDAPQDDSIQFVGQSFTFQ